MSQPESWLILEMEHGIQLLCRAGLKFRPTTADDQRARAEAWAVVVSPGHKWDSKADTPRFRRIFRELAAVSVDFPTPAEFLALTRSMSFRRGQAKLQAPAMTEDQVRLAAEGKKRFLAKVEALRGPMANTVKAAAETMRTDDEK